MIYFVEMQMDVGDKILLFYFILFWCGLVNCKKKKKIKKSKNGLSNIRFNLGQHLLNPEWGQLNFAYINYHPLLDFG